jgi:hypothetical protein
MHIILRSTHTVYLCVLCGSQNKQRLCPCTTLTDRLLIPRCSVFTARYELGLYAYNPTFCPHSVFMCFVWISEQTAIISLYSINWLVFIAETECVYCAVRTGSLYIIQVEFSLQKFRKICSSSCNSNICLIFLFRTYTWQMQ